MNIQGAEVKTIPNLKQVFIDGVLAYFIDEKSVVTNCEFRGSCSLIVDSIVENCVFENASISRSKVDGSVIKNSAVRSSSVESSEIDGSTILNTTIFDAKVVNSYTLETEIKDSTVETCELEDSEAESVYINELNVHNMRIDQSGKRCIDADKDCVLEDNGGYVFDDLGDDWDDLDDVDDVDDVDSWDTNEPNVLEPVKGYTNPLEASKAVLEEDGEELDGEIEVLTDEEAELVDYYRSLDLESQKLITKTVKILALLEV